MEKNRLEAFSDGVLAIILTIMVLEMKVQPGWEFSNLEPVLPIFLSYVLSFIYVGIYWNNHHHLLAACNKVNAGIMWANLHLLFWLSLLPFVTGWMGENHFKPLPSALYGGVLFLSAIAYFILQNLIIAQSGKDSELAASIGRDTKGKLSGLLYLSGIGTSFCVPWLASVIYFCVAVMWLIPDRRVERVVEKT